MKKVFATSVFATLAAQVLPALMLVGCTTSTPDSAQDPVRKCVTGEREEINYHFYKKDGDLVRIVAVVDGKEYTIPCREKIECEYLGLEAVMDFDRDGNLDVLLAAENMLDCSRAFYFVSYQGNGHFAVSEQFGQCVDYKIAYTMDETTIEVSDEELLEDGQYDIFHQSFKLDHGKAVKVSETKEERIEGTLLQIVPKDITIYEEYVLTCDLNGDGKKDTIACTGGETCESGFDAVLKIDGEEFALPFTDRLGILPTKTRGYQDLVLSLNTIMVWDGEEYVEKE